MADPVLALRDWLRGHAAPGTLDVPADRVACGRQAGDEPCIDLFRVGGGRSLAGEAPIYTPLVQLDVWGKDSQTETAALKEQVIVLLDSIAGATQLDGTTWCYGADFQSELWLPDPASGRPRYALTYQLTTRFT